MHPYSYETAFRRASQRAYESLKRIELDRRHAPAQLVELLALSPPERKRALESSSRFHNYSLATQTLRRCEQELFCDPFKACELARLARSFVGHIDPRTCGGAEALVDLGADALAMEANALRVQGDFRMSLKVFAKARVIQQRGGIEPDLRAKIDLLESSLRRDLWQFDLALALLDRATEDFVALGEQERVARAIVGRANIYLVQGDWSSAAAILRTALDWPFDSQITLWARHNLADVLVKAGRAAEAAHVFSTTQALYDRCTDVLTTNRRLWVEGLIVRELDGDLKQAADLIETATESFMAHGYAHDAALAQLDLVATRRKLKDSRRTRTKRLANPLHPRVASTQ